MFFPLFYLMCPFFPCFPTSSPNATTNKFHFGIAQGDPAVLIPHKSQTFKFRDVFPPFPLLQVPGMPNDRFPKVIPGLGIGKNPFFQEEIWFIPHHFGPKNCSAPEENVGYFLHPTSPNKPIPRNTYLLISSLIILRFFFNNNFFPLFPTPGSLSSCSFQFQGCLITTITGEGTERSWLDEQSSFSVHSHLKAKNIGNFPLRDSQGGIPKELGSGCHYHAPKTQKNSIYSEFKTPVLGWFPLLEIPEGKIQRKIPEKFQSIPEGKIHTRNVSRSHN